MPFAARTLRYLGILVVDSYGSSQHTSRANAAEASARLRERRDERAEVEAFLCAWDATSLGSGETETSQDLRGAGWLREFG